MKTYHFFSLPRLIVLRVLPVALALALSGCNYLDAILHTNSRGEWVKTQDEREEDERKFQIFRHMTEPKTVDAINASTPPTSSSMGGMTGSVIRPTL